MFGRAGDLYLWILNQSAPPLTEPEFVLQSVRLSIGAGRCAMRLHCLVVSCGSFHWSADPTLLAGSGCNACPGWPTAAHAYASASASVACCLLFAAWCLMLVVVGVVIFVVVFAVAPVAAAAAAAAGVVVFVVAAKNRSSLSKDVSQTVILDSETTPTTPGMVQRGRMDCRIWAGPREGAGRWPRPRSVSCHRTWVRSQRKTRYCS